MSAKTERVLEFIRSAVAFETGEDIDIESVAYDNGFVKRDRYTGEYVIPQHHLQDLADMFEIEINVCEFA